MATTRDKLTLALILVLNFIGSTGRFQGSLAWAGPGDFSLCVVSHIKDSIAAHLQYSVWLTSLVLRAEPRQMRHCPRSII